MLLTVTGFSRSCEHFPERFDLNLLHQDTTFNYAREYLTSEELQNASKEVPEGTQWALLVLEKVRVSSGNKIFHFKTRLREEWLKRPRETETRERIWEAESKVGSQMWFQIFCASVNASTEVPEGTQWALLVLEKVR